MGKRKDETAWTRLPEDWQPSAELMQWAIGKRPDMTRTDIQDEVENFKEYWDNKRGKAGEKKDWDRAFQTWMRNTRQRYKPRFQQQHNSSGGGVVL